MTPKDAPRFFQLLAQLSVMHRIELDKPTARIYFEALNDVPLDVLEGAFRRLLKHAGEWMPKTEEIRLTCDDIAAEQHAERQRALPQQNPLLLGGESADREEKHITLPTGEQMTVSVLQGVSGYHCTKCDDTGYAKVCQCSDPSICQRGGRRMDDDYCGSFYNGKSRLPVRRCDCYETNPELLRRRALRAAAPSFTGGKGKGSIKQRGHKFPGNRYSYEDRD